MAKKEFTYRGFGMEQLAKMSLKEFAELLPARQRRSLIKRGMSEQEKLLLKKILSGKTAETHSREMIIIPAMVGRTVKVYDGKSFAQVIIEPDMIGHALGEFAPTRKRVAHHAPGIGATRSSASLSVR